MLLKRFNQVSRAVGNVQRGRVIVRTFMKYGFEDVARHLPLPGMVVRRLQRRHTLDAVLSQPERLRMAFEELGPTFVKLGQLLSTRSHLLPKPFLIELSKLQDSVPPIPFSEVTAILERELKGPVDSHFACIEEIPIGSASIAQVHRATLPSGERVVVKVRRPGIEQMVRSDLEIIAWLAGLLENNVEGWKAHRPTAVVAEFARRISQELDLCAEAGHIERFAAQFKDESTLHVPRVHANLSTRQVLIMEYVDGVRASSLNGAPVGDIDRSLVATRLADLVLKQIFVHGFFHADPHPGNIFIMRGDVICFLDFGMMGFLDQQTRENFAAVMVSVAQRNEVNAATALLKLAHAELDPPRPGLENDVSEFMHQHLYRPMGEMMFGPLATHLFALTSRHQLTMPPDLFVMLKALSEMEGLVGLLAPDHDVLEQARPFVQDIGLNRVRPKRLLHQLFEFGGGASTLLKELPMELRRLAAQLTGGRVKLTFHHDGLEPLNNTLERVSNRISFSVVLAALLIGSSVIIHAGLPPRWHGVPLIGLAGFLFSGLMGAWLLVSILRHGKM
jgi:ubiquinone biosynthesis protein